MKKNKSHFNDTDILRQEEEFIRCYADTKAGPMKMLLRLYKGYYGRILLAALFYAIKVSPVWVIPIVTSNAINIATTRPNNSIQLFLANLIVVLFILFLNIPFHTLYAKNMSVARRNVEAGLRGAMVRKLQQLSITFYKELQSGRIQSKIMRDVEAVEALSAQICDTLLGIFLNLSVSMTVVLIGNPFVFLFFLVCVPVASITTYAFRKKLRNSNSEFRQEIEHTSADVMDMVELIPVTRAHSVENTEVQRLTEQLQLVAEKGYRLDKIQSLFGATSWVVFNAFQIICLFTTSYMAYKGQISVGEIALYQTYFTSIVNQVSSLIGLLPMLTKGTESIRSIGEILSANDIEDNQGKKRITDLKGEFDFNNVTFKYADAEKPVVNGLDLHVKAGETIALVGGSGAGKSTVLNMVIGFYKANSGELLIDGNNINDIDLRSFRSQIAVVPQTSILFSGTIRDNITYGLSGVSEDHLRKTIKAANLESFIDSLPNGLDTVVGEHGGKLSGGQRQRISIARAIIRDPKVIIFDEATSALDSISEKEIQSAINNMTVGRTTFIVAHRLSTIRDADRIAVMKDGRCEEIGTYDELMELKGEFYNLKTLQS